jgi:hypothetical protein
MANKKINVEIEDFEDKKSQNGKRYTRFKTSDGWMSAFEKDIIDSLKAAEGKTVCVEIAVDEEKGFKNIRKFIGAAQDTEETETKSKPVVLKDTTTMYVSYAKDIFISLVSNLPVESHTPAILMSLMKTSTELVKQAKLSFEKKDDEYGDDLEVSEEKI